MKADVYRLMRTKYFLVFLVTLVFSSCGSSYQKPYQDQPLKSPSGKYVLTVPIEKAADKHDYWRVTIADTDGKVLFKDDSRFVGNLNVYWTWDKEDRVWLHNSDNGFTYYWEVDKKDRWRRFDCDHRDPQLPQAGPSPDESGVVPKWLPCTLSPLKIKY
jgi:hypothetical protein